MFLKVLPKEGSILLTLMINFTMLFEGINYVADQEKRNAGRAGREALQLARRKSAEARTLLIEIKSQ